MIRIEETFTAQIYMAGDIAQAKQFLRREAADVGMCVTVEPLDFIYSGGEEAGFRIGFINYPRFPSEPLEIENRALTLARRLRDELGQHSFSIVMPDRTIWDSRRKRDGGGA